MAETSVTSEVVKSRSLEAEYKKLSILPFVSINTMTRVLCIEVLMFEVVRGHHPRPSEAKRIRWLYLMIFVTKSSS